MRKLRMWKMTAVAALCVAGLAGCGGGADSPGTGSTGTGGGSTAPAASLSATVAVNGAVAVPDASGRYAVKPGDTIEVTPSQSADWSTSSSITGAIALRNPAISPAKWSAQVVNGTTNAVTYAVSAKATANGALTRDTVFTVRAADVRNAEYKVFASNGTQQVLALNFDTMSYEMTDAAGAKVADALVADPASAGGYLFKSSRITSAVNNASFRVTDNTVVGSFPFELTLVTPVAYAVQPFIASNAFVTVQSTLDGNYSRLGINLNAGSRDSNIRTAQFSSGGTVYLLCDETAITAVSSCPTASLIRYTVAAEPGVPGGWRILNAVNPSDTGVFFVARVAGQNVYLAAGAAPLFGPGSRNFRIGLMDTTALPRTTARGGDTNGASTTTTLDSSTYTVSSVGADGVPSSLSYAVNRVGAFGIWGINQAGTNRYFAAHNGRLTAVVGARGPIGGYLQLGLTD